MLKLNNTTRAIADIENAEYDNALFDMLFSDAQYDEMRAQADLDNAAFRSTALVVVAKTQTTIEQYQSQLIAAIDSRRAYEVEKNADNDSMLAKLKSFRVTVAHARIAELMLTANVDSNLINRQERVNARYNEKAFVKVVNIARALAKVETLNSYTRAILHSVKMFCDNEMLLTETETRACCSNNGRIDNVSRNSLLQRVSKFYEASTVSTQASSSNNALQAYDVIRETRDANGKLAFTLNRESATTQALLALL